MRLSIGTVLAFSVLAVAQVPSNRQFRPSVFFNLTLPPTFPYILFNPDGTLSDEGGVNFDGTLSDFGRRWELGYTDGPNSDYVAGMMGQGTATMTSARVDGLNLPKLATDLCFFQLEYPGSGVWIHGSWDGQSDDPYAKDASGNEFLRLSHPYFAWDPGYPTNDLVFGVSQLGFAFNRVWLYNRNGTLSITGLTLTTGMVTEAPTFDDVNITVVPFVTSQNERNPAINFAKPYAYMDIESLWKVSQSIGGVNGQPAVSYKTVNRVPDSIYSNISIPVPLNTSFAILNGTIGPDHGAMKVEVSPPMRTFGNGSSPTWGNCTSRWVSSGILWFSPLDPTVQYNITIQPILSSSATLGFHSISFYSGLWNGPSASDYNPVTRAPQRKRTSAGVIAGAVVGGVAGLAMIIALGWVCMARRASRKAERAEWAVEPSRVVVPETAAVNTTTQPPIPGPSAHDTQTSTSDRTPSLPEEEADDDVELLPPTYKPQWSVSTG